MHTRCSNLKFIQDKVRCDDERATYFIKNLYIPTYNILFGFSFFFFFWNQSNSENFWKTFYLKWYTQNRKCFVFPTLQEVTNIFLLFITYIMASWNRYAKSTNSKKKLYYIRSFILIIRLLTFQMIRIGLAKNHTIRIAVVNHEWVRWGFMNWKL